MVHGGQTSAHFSVGAYKHMVYDLAFFIGHGVQFFSGALQLCQILCELGDPFEVPEQTPVLWYLALRAADTFKTQKGRYPGEEDHQVMCFHGVCTSVILMIIWCSITASVPG